MKKSIGRFKGKFAENFREAREKARRIKKEGIE